MKILLSEKLETMPLNFIKTLRFLGILILTSLNLIGQNQKHLIHKNNLKFYHYDTSNGLSNNMVSSITEDEFGFIWIGTNSGLNRFDGNEFENFDKENSGLTNNYIQQIVPSKNGNLYLATNHGLHTYRIEKNLLSQNTIHNSHLSDGITSILELPNNLLAIGAYSFGVHFIKDNRQIPLNYHNKRKNVLLEKYRISALALKDKNTILAGTYSNGIYSISIKDTSVTKIKKLFSGRINVIYKDSENQHWVGTDEGLLLIKANDEVLHLTTNNSPLNDSSIRSLVEDDDGFLWIGTSNGGINILDPSSVFAGADKIKVQKFIPHTDDSSVHNRNILSLFKDSNGNIWIGTEAGLDFVDPKGEVIQLFDYKPNDNSQISHDRVKAITKGNNNNIWIGTDGGGIDNYAIASKEFSHLNINLHSNLILSLLEDDNRNLWIGTYRYGIIKYNLNTGKSKVYLDTKVSEGSDVRIIFEDRQSNIWVGTNRGGLYKYDKLNDSFTYIEELGKLDIRDIKQKDENEIWLATYGNGIINYNFETGKRVDFHTANTNFPINIIFSFEFIDENTLLVGTMNEGLLKFDINTKAIDRFTTYDGLSNNTINSITRDLSGNFWIGTNDGISLYNITSNTLKNLNNFNNIQESEFNIGASLVTEHGDLFIGGNKGLNIFNTKNLSNPEKETFPTVFKNLEIYGKPLTVNDSAQTVLNKPISLADTITINYNQALFSLDFSALKYPKSSNIEYSYILEGYNDHWINIKNANRINFSQLPPGDYNLKLKTNDNDYLESSNQLHISVVPPLWKTPAAYVFYLFLASFIIWFSLKYYTDRIKLKQSLIFEKSQRELEQELNEERLRFYTGFSHELKTPLTMILAPVETLLTEIRKKEHKNSLRIIEKNAKTLLRRINKLLDFRQTEEGLNKLQVNNYDLKSSLKHWIKMYEPIAQKKEIKIITSYNNDKSTIYCDIEKIQIVFNNIMSNAIKYTPTGGSIKIKLKEKNNGFQFSVKDSGTGIPPKNLPHIFDWYYHSDEKIKKEGSGIGLALSKRFIEIHGGKISVKSKENKYTKFKVYLPIANEKGYENDISDKESFSEIERFTKELLNENKQLENRALLNPDSNRELLLLIDDNPDIHHYLSSILKEKYDLLHALNGQEGINMAKKHVPDLIVSDIMMPEKSGIDLTNTLKTNKETTHIPIILLSAKDTKESILSGYTEGADDYITKPFSTAILQARIKNLLNKKISLQKSLQQNEDSEISKSDTECKQIKIEKEFLKKFEKTVHDNIQIQGKMVELISKEMGMSRASLYRKIKALTGKSINEYIRDIKLEKSLNLIEKEGFNISTAAFEVGFNNMKYYRKIFKEKFGKLPSEFSLKKDLT
ncbi:hybrid sensor histidine kinase/response regulator transcription factor [Zunongwangia sp. HRR-M8]|uniref:hybrid sensor histidine kinase/response regulator transcription factor n=1 Tax=Zunongwangia sp. HRR-M8 TaxID=3015170 RepID=UPI0022DE079D|nr:two-component regulator propeller domain-containing protein [Zunongwangia sp. HRR-M8]WBL21566.1 ATP-binding protein [Zunongwangia sp. HRR-M8]